MQTASSEIPPPLPPAGGAFLTDALTPEQVFTPEDHPDEARLMAHSVERFLRREVLPLAARLEAQEPDLLSDIMRAAGTLGVLGVNLPEAYGGLNLPKTTIALLTERMALNAAFAVGVGVHFGVGVLPLYYFGTDAQKEAYLPRLASGAWIGAFALSEPNAGSDALAAQTNALLTSDGRFYSLNGAKAWITNAAVADLFTVFAKINGERLTAFLVPRDTPGLSIGPEEEKLGLKASSTRALILQNARVPVENVLGEIGKGHQPALYALNNGRLTIAATALGMAKEALHSAVAYAGQRAQFGRPLTQFPLIRQKFADMTIKIYALESMMARVGGAWDLLLKTKPPRPDSGEPEREDFDLIRHVRAASEEYAIECSILKFTSTEILRDVIDEALQIHGGYGFSEKYPIAQAYRDARVFRIFEGTNEINRLIVMDQWFKRLNSGRLTLMSVPPIPDGSDDAATGISRIRRSVVMLLEAIHHAWSEWSREEIAEQQEVLSAMADCCAEMFACESAWLRACKRRASGSANADVSDAATLVLIDGAFSRIAHHARLVLSVLPGNEPVCRLRALREFLTPMPLDLLALRRTIVDHALHHDGIL